MRMEGTVGVRVGAAISDPVLRGLAALTVVLFPWFLSGWGGELSFWALQTFLDVVIAWTGFRMALKSEQLGASRRFWWAVAFAAVSCTIGDVTQTWLTLVGYDTGAFSVTHNVLDVLGMMIVMGATLAHPLGGAGRQRLQFWLDAATVLVGAMVFLWYYLVAERITAERYAAAGAAAAMVLVVFGVMKIFLSGTAPFRLAPGILATLGVAGMGLTAPASSMMSDATGQQLMYPMQVLPCVLLALGINLQRVLNRFCAGGHAARPHRGISQLPYIAVLATQVLLLMALFGVKLDARVWGVALGSIVITAFVLVRQRAAFQDNERLMQQVQDEREWFRSLVQNASDVIVLLDAGGTVSYVSPAVHRVLGVPADLVLGTHLQERVHPEDLHRVDDFVALLGTSGRGEMHARLRHADGSLRWMHVVGTNLQDNPSVGGVVLNARDVHEARMLQEKLRHQATHDSLTGLANRVLLAECLRESTSGIVFLAIDLDGFKDVNDRHGHQSGDKLLVAVARRLTAALPDGALVARLGGDEFAVLLTGSLAEGADAVELARYLTAELSQPVLVDGLWLTVGASVGIAAGSADQGEQVMHDADVAMYERKRARSTADA